MKRYHTPMKHWASYYATYYVYYTVDGTIFNTFDKVSFAHSNTFSVVLYSEYLQI